MILAFRQKLRPTAAQHRLLAERLERQRELYNASLQERRDAWRLSRKAVTRLDQQKSLTVIRADDPDGHGADPVNMGRWTLKRVEDAFTGFFSRVRRGRKAGFPRFRSAARWRSFGLLEACGIRLEGGRLHLKGMDRGIRLNHDRTLPQDARLLSVVFTRRERHWFVNFLVETTEVVAVSHESADDAVGIDLGVEALATLSTGDRIRNVRPASRRAREIRRSRRALARCRKGSNRRRKVRAKLGRQLAKIANARNNHLNQVSATLTKAHSLIAMERLSVANMTRSAAGSVEKTGTNVAQKRGLNRAILDAGWSELARMIRYKAERAGGELILVEARGTSVACSECGAAVPKLLSERRHRCGCGLDLHRDVNAARVILARGLAAQAASEGGLPLGDANVGRRAMRRPGTLLVA
ncbi:RNA-guided endonuclease InsQ/TnpB family protein [Methylobacterium sp. 092160098-2]|uniref:RNA-guided endonuclease InsQ/TnpB family protein n=1 Tax=Methylobacterium sp. 092160098-2 TaxID=3025129 RepID=UPI002381C0CE|nr:transposase [Methylobacterium sp. 092160098-2]MDE4914797.1 transposase [Methylobacterium sp. 092160098-2]